IGTFGKLVPYNKADKEPWTWKIPGGIIPQWVIRLFHGKRDFWREDVLDANGEIASVTNSGTATPRNETVEAKQVHDDANLKDSTGSSTEKP
ncbi:hypothetical protein KEM55_006695, partial [Ascosphaera atra]